MSSLLLLGALLSEAPPPVDLDTAVALLRNEDVYYASGLYVSDPKLAFPVWEALWRARWERGAGPARRLLLARLDDPAAYAAAHVALVDLALTDGPIYGDSKWLDPNIYPAGEVPDLPPTWAGRLFFYGLEYVRPDKGPPRVIPVGRKANRARLKRYWAEHFAGLRNDFRVGPPMPGDADPRVFDDDPPPVRPADDPLPEL